MLTQNLIINKNLIYDGSALLSGSIESDSGNISYRITINGSVFLNWVDTGQYSVNISKSILYDDFSFEVNNLVVEFTDTILSDSKLFLVERVITELYQPIFVYPNYVELTWKPYNFLNLSAYLNTKILRSESPDFGTFTEFMITDIDTLSFIDDTLAEGTFYYKLLVNLRINAFTGDKIDFDEIEASFYILSSDKLTFSGGVVQLSFSNLGDNVGYTLGSTPVTSPYSEVRSSYVEDIVVSDLNPIDLKSEIITGLNIVSANDAPLTITGACTSSSVLGQGIVYSWSLTRYFSSITFTDADTPTISEVTKLGYLRYAFSVDGESFKRFNYTGHEYLETYIYPLLSSDNSPIPYIVAASSSMGDPLYLAFGDAGGTYRTSGGTPAWISVYVGESVKWVWKWGFQINGDFDVYLQGSINGTDWTNLHYKSERPGPSTNNQWTYTLPLYVGYNYFRLYFTYAYGSYGSVIHISNIKMFEYVPISFEGWVAITDVAYEGMTEEDFGNLTADVWGELYHEGSMYIRTAMKSNSHIKPCYIDSVYFSVVPANHYYFTTGDQAQLDSSDWLRVNSIEITQYEPVGSSIRYAFSFDDRLSWKVYNGSWTLIDINFLYLDGMSATEITTMDMTVWSDMVGGTIDLAISLCTTSPSASPSVDQFTFNYTTVPNPIYSKSISIPVPELGFLNEYNGSVYIKKTNRYSYKDGIWAFSIPSTFNISPYSRFKGIFEVGKVVYQTGFKNFSTTFAARDTLRFDLPTKFHAVTEHGFFNLETIFSLRETVWLNMETRFYLKPPKSTSDIETAFVLVYTSKLQIAFNLRASFNLPVAFRATYGSNLSVTFKARSQSSKYSFIM